MTDSPVSASTLFDWARVVVRGEESEAFLQGQLTQDVTARTDGVWSALLMPNSVVVTCGVLSSAEGGLDFVVPRATVEDAVKRLRRFLLRARCSIEFDGEGDGPFATEGERVAASWPGPAEYAAQLTPHSFGRHFIETAISFQKGCFTGQELVGRLDARGASVPWRLVRAEGASLAEIEAVLRARGPAGPQGVTSAVVVEDHVEALGFAHRTLLGGDTGAVSVIEVP